MVAMVWNRGLVGVSSLGGGWTVDCISCDSQEKIMVKRRRIGIEEILLLSNEALFLDISN